MSKNTPDLKTHVASTHTAINQSIISFRQRNRQLGPLGNEVFNVDIYPKTINPAPVGKRY